jgi:two-component system chemotaxis response regulator CheY
MAHDRRVRTLIIDDDEDMRLLASSLIRIAGRGLEVIGQAENATTGLARWRELHPDVVVLDQRMPDRVGIDVAEEMLNERPGQPIVLFSAYVDYALVDAAERIGICSVLDKDRFSDLPDEIWTCANPPA